VVLFDSGVYLYCLSASNPFGRGTKIKRGDRITLVGKQANRLTCAIGFLPSSFMFSRYLIEVCKKKGEQKNHTARRLNAFRLSVFITTHRAGGDEGERTQV
jgi:hypothetical protein